MVQSFLKQQHKNQATKNGVHLIGQEVVSPVHHLQLQEPEGLIQDHLQHEIHNYVPKWENPLWESGEQRQKLKFWKSLKIVISKTHELFL